MSYASFVRSTLGHALGIQARLLICLALGLLCAPGARAATEAVERAAVANRARGTGEVVDAGPFDQVNLFNGNLSLSLALGQSFPVTSGFSYQLAVRYNSLVWDFEVGAQGTAAYPVRDANAGLGWDLSLGRLHGPTEPVNPTGRWLYVGPDGGLHRFYPTLHPGEPAIPGLRYSRGATYLQLADVGSGKILRFAEGRRLTFAPFGGRWRLERMEDRNGSGVGITYSADESEWTLTDDHGREQVVRFAADPTGTYPRLLSSVELSAFEGARALYSFAYTTTTLSRPAADDSPDTPATVTVPVLSEIVLPDGTRYAMEYLPSAQDVGGGANEVGGLLRSLTLPTLGRAEWSYTARKFPWLDCTSGANRHLVDGTGVAGRTLFDRSGAVAGLWSFETALDVERPRASTCAQPRQLTVTVTTPLGHQRRQYFSVYVSDSSASPGAEPWRLEEYAWPLNKNAQDASGLLLSQQVLEAGVVRRSSRVAFEQDGAATCTPTCVERNVRRRAARTVFHDDGGRFVETTASGFDGFGHFGTTVRASNFEGEAPRTTTTVYLNDTSQWLLGQAVEDRVQRGSEVRVTKRCLDAYGRPRLERRLAAGTEGLHDLVSRWERDAAGNVVAVEHFGGDVQSLATNPNLCSLSLPAPQYREEREYEAGVVRAARWVGPAGETVLATLDRDIDPATGLAAASRDASGLETSQNYDILGRLVEVAYPQQYRSTTLYAASSSSEPARQTTTHRSENGQTVLALDRVELDGFGRRIAQETRSETGTWEGDRAVFDAFGQRIAEVDPLGRTTQYLDFDPFGRARRKLPPAGASAQVTYEHTGIRTLRTTRSEGHYLRESDNGLVEAVRSNLEVLDSEGRLVRSEAADGTIRRHEYDLDSNLIRVSSETAVDPQIALSTRRYDGRGLLVEETDADGEALLYFGYDALGNLTREEREGAILLRELDRAGRLVRVAVEGGPVLKELSYAAENDIGEWGAGKLRQAVRYNHGVPGVAGPLRVVEDFSYAGRGGRLSERTTSLRDDSGVKLAFSSSATYAEMGQLASLGYPECDRSWNLVCVPNARTVSYSYHFHNRRFLKSVASQHGSDPPVDFLGNAFYFPDGTLQHLEFSSSPLAYQVFTAHPQHAWRYSEASICTAFTCNHYRPMVYDSAGQLARYQVGPMLSDEVQLLPISYPEPPTARAPLAELRSTLADAAEAPGCPTVHRDALGLVVRSDQCVGGGLAPAAYFYVYDSSDHLLWRAASLNGTTLASWGHRWHLFDLAGRSVREYDLISPAFNWIRDSIWRGRSLVGWVEIFNGLETAADRHHVHVDPFGAPVSKYRIENGSVIGWSRW